MINLDLDYLTEKQYLILDNVINHTKKLIDNEIYNGENQKSNTLDSVPITYNEIMESIGLTDDEYKFLEYKSPICLCAYVYLRDNEYDSKTIKHVFSHLDKIIENDPEYIKDIDDAFFIATQLDRINSLEENGFSKQQLFQALLVDEEVIDFEKRNKILNPKFASKKLNALRLMSQFDISPGLDPKIKDPVLIIAVIKAEALGVDKELTSKIKNFGLNNDTEKLSVLSSSKNAEEFARKADDIMSHSLMR